MPPHSEHHKRELVFLIGFLIVFFAIFAITLLNLMRGIPILGVGLPYFTEDSLIIFLAVIAIVKVFWHITAY